MSRQDAANIAWSLAVLQQLALIPSLLGNRRWNANECSLDACGQVYVANMCWMLEGKGSSVLKESDKDDCRAVLLSQRHKIGKLHLEVSKGLTLMGMTHRNEFVVEGLVVDIALEKEKIIVEVDGPQHFIRNVDRLLLDGKTRFKHRLLRLLGWRVISIAVSEWGRIPVKNRHNELRRLLET